MSVTLCDPVSWNEKIDFLLQNRDNKERLVDVYEYIIEIRKQSPHHSIEDWYKLFHILAGKVNLDEDLINQIALEKEDDLMQFVEIMGSLILVSQVDIDHQDRDQLEEEAFKTCKRLILNIAKEHNNPQISLLIIKDFISREYEKKKISEEETQIIIQILLNEGIHFYEGLFCVKELLLGFEISDQAKSLLIDLLIEKGKNINQMNFSELFKIFSLLVDQNFYFFDFYFSIYVYSNVLIILQKGDLSILFKEEVDNSLEYFDHECYRSEITRLRDLFLLAADVNKNESEVLYLGFNLILKKLWKDRNYLSIKIVKNVLIDIHFLWKSIENHHKSRLLFLEFLINSQNVISKKVLDLYGVNEAWKKDAIELMKTDQDAVKPLARILFPDELIAKTCNRLWKELIRKDRSFIAAAIKSPDFTWYQVFKILTRLNCDIESLDSDIISALLQRGIKMSPLKYHIKCRLLLFLKKFFINNSKLICNKSQLKKLLSKYFVLDEIPVNFNKQNLIKEITQVSQELVDHFEMDFPNLKDYIYLGAIHSCIDASKWLNNIPIKLGSQSNSISWYHERMLARLPIYRAKIVINQYINFFNKCISQNLKNREKLSLRLEN